MFKHCLSKFSCALVLMCALVTGGSLQSCKDELDDYKYDDSEPTWLGSSIYDFLNKGAGGHTYQEYVKIIEALGLKDVLARTGSKTLFIADDAAFAEFYANNNWGVSKFEDFSDAQLKVILYNSMLDNAYLLDMLSSRPAGSDTSLPTEGSCLRRTTSGAMMDTVAHFSDGATTREGFRLPQNNKFFDRFREANGGKGLRVVMGASDPVMVHFLNEYVSNNHIEDTDFDIFFNFKKTRTGTEAFVYDRKVVTSGIEYDKYSDDTLTITCKNGYLYRMDGVLVPPSDMAQELREHPNTKLFSRMLDRFAYPLWGKEVVVSGEDLQSRFDYTYNVGDKEKEYVHVIKYSIEGASTFKDYTDYEGMIQNQETFNGVVLPYDPGNAQYAGSGGMEGDMAAMLVPNDSMVYRFFAPLSAQPSVNMDELTQQQKDVIAVGSSIVERYANKEDVAALNENDFQTIAPCLDSIPLNIVQAFIANLMKGSFLGTLPSNFDKVTNDARDPMGITPADVEECVVANNGIIYILNNVFGPAKYQAVMTPPLIMQNMRIMNKIIDDMDYDSYLLAMDSYFSFIVPDDEYFVYYDPVSLGSSEPLAWKFNYGKQKANAKEDGVWVDQYKRNAEGVFDLDSANLIKSINQVNASAKISETSDMGNRLHDLMEYLIIVDDVESGNQYYLTKGYGTVKCIVSEKGKAEGVKFLGGEQIEMQFNDPANDYGITVKQRFPEKNGVTYCTVAPDTMPGSTHPYKSGVVSPPTTSIKTYIQRNSENGGTFGEFNDVCEIVDDALLKSIFPLADVEDVTTDSLKKYQIFYNHKTTKEVSAGAIVPFFSTYHYTVYVPTDAAIEGAYKLGLPTREDVELEIAAGNLGRAASLIRLINKFARYHFQDNAVYVDKLPFSVTSAGVKYDTVRYETAAIDDATGRFFETIIKTNAGEYGPTITITDNRGRVAKILNKEGEEGKTWNILARDLYLKGTDPANASQITTSSFAVIHQIDSALYNSGVLGYDGKFRRFADDGELVDQIQVGNDTYLIGYRNSLIFDTAEGEVYKKTGYIMKPSANKTKLSQEEYVFRADTAKILITEDAYLINEDGKFINWEGNPLGVDSLGHVMFPDSIVKVSKDGIPVK